MQLNKFFKYTMLVLGVSFLPACKDYLDINVSPNAVLDAPIEQLLFSSSTTVGFFSGSDLHRFSALLAQQFSG
ncbi:MAG: hypothetical protein L6Q97_15405, partial [Thermoanaerobaculia bacterium]|nr:hypothetical protein [Thermoanaerobaculia bacterium]